MLHAFGRQLHRVPFCASPTLSHAAMQEQDAYQSLPIRLDALLSAKGIHPRKLGEFFKLTALDIITSKASRALPAHDCKLAAQFDQIFKDGVGHCNPLKLAVRSCCISLQAERRTMIVLQLSCFRRFSKSFIDHLEQISDSIETQMQGSPTPSCERALLEVQTFLCYCTWLCSWLCCCKSL